MLFTIKSSTSLINVLLSILFDISKLTSFSLKILFLKLKTSCSHFLTNSSTFDIKESFLFILQLIDAAFIKKNKLQCSSPVHASCICACNSI
ncbi:hypothetical protein BVAVS116_H0050 (plasmid) [Borreliella valaisiana VS116]|uniref:Uncharacterized protein n=1 Tax=Borreliella valaisiana VS116 TaxID=445987 RepID=C0R9A7_BORVA|nr:hypothetical protein BVAVS116_H0050 [Borreliella valaisiana VS116]